MPNFPLTGSIVYDPVLNWRSQAIFDPSDENYTGRIDKGESLMLSYIAKLGKKSSVHPYEAEDLSLPEWYNLSVRLFLAMGICRVFPDPVFMSLLLSHVTQMMMLAVSAGMRSALRVDRELRSRWTRYTECQMKDFDWKNELLAVQNPEVEQLKTCAINSVKTRTDEVNKAGYYGRDFVRMFCSGEAPVPKKKPGNPNGHKGGGAHKGNTNFGGAQSSNANGNRRFGKNRRNSRNPGGQSGNNGTNGGGKGNGNTKGNGKGKNRRNRKRNNKKKRGQFANNAGGTGNGTIFCSFILGSLSVIFLSELHIKSYDQHNNTNSLRENFL